MKLTSTKPSSSRLKAIGRKPVPKKILVILAVVFVGVPAVCMAYIALALTFHIGSITPAQADRKCQEFYGGVREQLDSVSGYTVVQSNKSCSPEQDELGSTDYNQHANFVVTGGDNSSVETVKNNLQSLGTRLKAEDFNLSLYNIPASGGNPPAICVSAYRYIDNDGKVYSQGINGVKPSYREPGSQGSLRGYQDCI